MKFNIVNFIRSKEEVEVVPANWLFSQNGKLYTYWPKYPDIESIRTAAKGGDPPNTRNWAKYGVRVLHEFGKTMAFE